MFLCGDLVIKYWSIIVNKLCQTHHTCGFLMQENEESSKHEEEGNSMSFLETQLRRKGLCLVPMSMLIKHLN